MFISTFKLGLRMIVLTFILLIAYMLAIAISGVSSAASSIPDAPSVDVTKTLLSLFTVSALEAIVFAYIILHSQSSGWKLIGAVFVAFYGLSTVVEQIESIVYLPRQLPPGTVTQLFVMGAIQAALYSPLAVLVLGKMKSATGEQIIHARVAIPLGKWVWNLGIIVATYLILYYTFGYFLTWKNPAVQEYYGGTDPGNFLLQISSIWETTPWMFPFQALRAILWTLFALPAIRLLKGKPTEIALATAGLFAVWSGLFLLPNPYMPETVTRAHLVETFLCDSIFGGVVGWLVSRQDLSVRN